MTCDDHNSDEELSNIRATLGVVKKTLDTNTSENITLEELLEKSQVSMEMYVKSLKVCSRGSSVAMKRFPSESGSIHTIQMLSAYGRPTWTSGTY